MAQWTLASPSLELSLQHSCLIVSCLPDCRLSTRPYLPVIFVISSNCEWTRQKRRRA